MSTEQEDMSNYKFLFKTVQASAIRTLIEALKEILTGSCSKLEKKTDRAIDEMIRRKILEKQEEDR